MLLTVVHPKVAPAAPQSYRIVNHLGECGSTVAKCGMVAKCGRLGSAPARLLRLLRARQAAPCSSALPGWAPATGIPAMASGAPASRLQIRPFHRV